MAVPRITKEDLKHRIDAAAGVAPMAALGRPGARRFQPGPRRDRLEHEPGISPAIHWYLREVALGGGDLAIRAAQAGVPRLIGQLLAPPALSTAEAATLGGQLGGGQPHD